MYCASRKVDKPDNDPFLPYDEALWVQHLSPSHTLLLNKFNVVEHHVLVVTRQFEKQMDSLNLQDIQATWQTMQVSAALNFNAYHNDTSSLFAHNIGHSVDTHACRRIPKVL